MGIIVRNNNNCLLLKALSVIGERRLNKLVVRGLSKMVSKDVVGPASDNRRLKKIKLICLIVRFNKNSFAGARSHPNCY